MEGWMIVLFFGFALMAGLALLLIPSLYVTVPPSEVMVRSTRTSTNEPSFFKEGRVLVIPLYHRYSNLSMYPMKVLFDHPTFLDQNNIRLKIKIFFTFAISEEHEALMIAARRFVGVRSSQIEEMASEIFLGELRNTVSVMSVEQINNDLDSFLSIFFANAGPELSNMGLYLIDCTVTKISNESGHVGTVLAKKQRLTE